MAAGAVNRAAASTASSTLARLGQVLVDSEVGATAQRNGRTLEDVIEEESQALDGVSRADVRLTGRRTAPVARVRLWLWLWLEPHGEPEQTLGRLNRETLARARDSASLDRLPSKVRLREVRHGAHRVDQELFAAFQVGISPNPRGWSASWPGVAALGHATVRCREWA